MAKLAANRSSHSGAIRPRMASVSTSVSGVTGIPSRFCSAEPMYSKATSGRMRATRKIRPLLSAIRSNHSAPGVREVESVTDHLFESAGPVAQPDSVDRALPQTGQIRRRLVRREFQQRHDVLDEQ